MNIFAKLSSWAEAAKHMGMTIDAVQQAVSETRTEATNPKAEAEGKASRDLYTTTKEFLQDVPLKDRNAFVRSLSNKTAGMVDGEVKVIHIYSTSLVYVFKADGYMHGEMIDVFSPAEYEEIRKARKEYKNEFNSDRKTADLWAQPIPDIGRGSRSDISLSERRGRSTSNDLLSENSSESNKTGDIEREWKNPRTKEEINEIVNKVRIMYGLDPVDYSKQGKASRKPNLIDNINELAGEESDAELTKSQKVAKVRGELERMNVGSGEIMQLQSVADKLFNVYAGESSMIEFRYGLLELTMLMYTEK